MKNKQLRVDKLIETSQNASLFVALNMPKLLDPEMSEVQAIDLEFDIMDAVESGLAAEAEAAFIVSQQ